jgi:hypothetical protein
MLFTGIQVSPFAMKNVQKVASAMPKHVITSGEVNLKHSPFPLWILRRDMLLNESAKLLIHCHVTDS